MSETKIQQAYEAALGDRIPRQRLNIATLYLQFFVTQPKVISQANEGKTEGGAWTSRGHSDKD